VRYTNKELKTRCGAVSWNTALQPGRSWVHFTM